MATFYMDENVPLELSEAIRALGHDVLTVQADGRASRSIEDSDVLARAIELGRAVITNDRRDYHRLHGSHPDHSGIITFTKMQAVLDFVRIDAAWPAGMEGNFTRS